MEMQTGRQIKTIGFTIAFTTVVVIAICLVIGLRWADAYKENKKTHSGLGVRTMRAQRIVRTLIRIMWI